MAEGGGRWAVQAAAAAAAAGVTAAAAAALTAAAAAGGTSAAEAAGVAQVRRISGGVVAGVEVEVRRDTDGKLYTRAEFVNEYGGAVEWEAAAELTSSATYDGVVKVVLGYAGGSGEFAVCTDQRGFDVYVPGVLVAEWGIQRRDHLTGAMEPSNNRRNPWKASTVTGLSKGAVTSKPFEAKGGGGGALDDPLGGAKQALLAQVAAVPKVDCALRAQIVPRLAVGSSRPSYIRQKAAARDRFSTLSTRSRAARCRRCRRCGNGQAGYDHTGHERARLTL